MELYLLACTDKKSGGGIYRYMLSEAGRLSPVSCFACDHPMYTVLRDGVLHTVVNNEAGKTTGGYFSLPLTPDGDFGLPAEVTPSLGVVPCHLTVAGDDTYLVNYATGNVVKNGQKSVLHSGCGPHPTRQNTAHTHFVELLPDGFLGVCDLGIDTLKIYDRELVSVGEARVPAGYGIRHFVTKKTTDGYQIYAVNELIPSVSRFAYENGSATYLDTVIIPCRAENPTAAAIRLSRDGGQLYVSVRAENTLCVLDVAENGSLTLVGQIPCGGNSPRDFALCGDYLVCTNQFSNSVTVFHLQEGRIGEMTDEITLPQPLCVVIKER